MAILPEYAATRESYAAFLCRRKSDTIRHLDAPGVRECVVRDERGGAIYLIALKVSEQYQGKGVGAFLIRSLQAEGRRIYLIPVADDPERQTDLERFYTRHGFYPCGHDYWHWRPPHE